MLRALLAWECGTGRGHLSSLRGIAESLGDRFEFDAALCIMQHADEIRPHCVSVFQGAYLPYDRSYRIAQGDVVTSTWGEYLGDLGFRDPQFLSRQISWWQEVIKARQISLVIGDFAPCAMLAAKGLGIPAITVGIGYASPPRSLRQFPAFIEQYAERLYDEADMVAVLNEAAVPLGVPEISHLPEIYATDAQIVRCVHHLDPYSEWRTDDLIPPGGSSVVRPLHRGDEVFVYFSTTEGSHPAIVEALVGLPMAVRAFVPMLDRATSARLEASGITVEKSAVPPSLIAARSRIMVNSAQHGTMCLGMAAALPQICVPQQLEQDFNGLRAERLGIAKAFPRWSFDATQLREAIIDAYEDTRMQDRASALAAELAPHFGRNGPRMIRRTVARLFD